MEYYDDDYDTEREEWEDEILDILTSVVDSKCIDVHNKNTSLQKIMENYKEEIKVLKRDTKVLESENKFTKGMEQFRGRVNKDNIFNVISGLGMLKTNGERYVGGMNSEKMPSTTKLILMYYNDRKFIFDMFDLFDIKYTISKDFLLPRDYDKELVMNILKNIDSQILYTNGCVLEDNFGFWSLKTDKIPLQELFLNPFMQDMGCFEIIQSRLANDKYSSYHYLYDITGYQEFKVENILELAECIPKAKHSNLNKSQKQFIERHKDILFNQRIFCEKYKEFMDDNHYNSFAVNNFPIGYQIKFLKNLSFNTAVELVNKFKIDDNQKKYILSEVVKDV